MNIGQAFIACLCMTLLMGCTGTGKQDNRGEGDTELSFTLSNDSDTEFNGKVFTIDLKTADASMREVDWSSASLSTNSEVLPMQAVDRDADGTVDQLLVLASLRAGESVVVNVNTDVSAVISEKKTHAELSIKKGGEWKDRVYKGGEFFDVEELAVPPEHTDHSFFIRYEGPGWESEKVGYRFYLDWRNAIDIFGKTENALVLDQVGLDGFDSYHEMADWGMDILKVGDALGIGALGCWSNGKALRISQTDSVHCAIAQDDDLESTVRTTYFGWVTPYGKSDLVSALSIQAGDRKTRHDVTLSSSCDSLCTGIVKHPDTEVIAGTADEGWNYLGTWGVQSLAGDNLGMVIFYHNNDLLMVGEDEFNQIVVLKPPSEGRLTYYFAACWEQEENGIKTKSEFEAYMQRIVAELNNEDKVTVSGI